MDEGWGLNIGDLDKMIQKFEQMDKNINRIADKVTLKMAETVKPTLSAEMPRSDTPKPPSKKEQWRTGKHAADEIEIVKAKSSKGGRTRYRIVGFKNLETKESPHWYMRLVREGIYGTSRKEPNDFISRTLNKTRRTATEAGLAVLKGEVEK